MSEIHSPESPLKSANDPNTASTTDNQVTAAIQQPNPTGDTQVPNLPLDRFYHWEAAKANELYLSQPYGNGKIEEFTWARVGKEARSMATYLRSLELDPGSRIGILSKNCAHWVMSDLAIWLAGHVSVPLYPTLTADSIRPILEHSECEVLFVGKLDDWPAQAAGVPESVRCISYPLSPPNEFKTWDDIVKEYEPMAESPKVDPQQLATIVYTSGTTGMPKGVMHTFAGMGFAAQQAGTIYKVNEKDRILSYLPLSHVAERMCVEIVSFFQGFTIYFADSLDTFNEDLKRAEPTIFFAVPRIWIKFQQAVFKNMPQSRLNLLLKIPLLSGVIKKKLLTALGLHKTRLSISGAAPISPSLLTWYSDLGLEILEGYGMTENMGYSHLTRPGESLPGSVGRSNPGVLTNIAESGEVQVKSPATMVGYYKEPEKTAEVLTEDGYLCTGDIGRVDAQGRLTITGRIKEIFKTSKGKYVAPAPIENLILADGHIELACVVGSGLPQPIALGMLNEDARDLDRAKLQGQCEELLTELNQRLDHHERLAALVLVSDEWTTENGILTPTLKTKRNVIDEKYGANYEAWYEDKRSIIFA